MAISKEQEILQLKFGYAFKKFIESNKRTAYLNKKKGREINSFDDSYGKISSSTGLRAASISDIVSGKSNLKISTLNALLESLGKSYTDLAKILDKVTDLEIADYKNSLNTEKSKSRKK